MNLPPLVRLLLWPLSLLYGQVVRLRLWLYAKGIFKTKRLSKPVISIGNLTVGGTGKTPMAIWLAERLIAEGHRVGILSRGYKGRQGTSDEIGLMKERLQGAGCGSSQPATDTVTKSAGSTGFQPASSPGDAPPSFCEGGSSADLPAALFGVGADRFAAGQRIESQVDIFLLDDGFQHLPLARDLDILLIDASQPLARQTLLPTGRLREPLSAIARADVLVFTRTETVSGTTAAIEKFENVPVFSAATRLLGFRRFRAVMHIVPPGQIGSGPFYAFCGVGNPRAFFQDLQNWGLSLADRCEFPDHHRYDARDVRELQEAASQAGAKALLTTEKDAQNLEGLEFPSLPLYLAVIDLDVPKADALLSLVRQKIESPVHAA